MNIETLLKTPEYDFLRNNEHLNSNIILLGFGGSHAYGTNNENSDVDIRGVATNTKRNILTGYDFEQVVDVDTDTTVYSFDKIIKLLCSCNPNVIELLGLKPEHYFYLTSAGVELLNHKEIFLSKKAVHSFGGYANAQLRRLENKSARLVSQSQMEQHILKSIEHASVDFKNRYFDMPEDSIRLFIDESQQEEYDTEIFMDVSLKHYPLRDYKGMLSSMGEIIKSYSKIGKRNEKAISHDKLGKHMQHLIRLYYMCFDILEKGEINTFRENEHELLMSIRNGEYLNENNQPITEFYEMVDDLEKRLDYDAKNTFLPDDVDMKEVNDFVESINDRVVKNG